MITSGSKYRICRRLGPGVYEKCQTAKFAQSQARRSGKKSTKKPKSITDFGLQLIEKQKIRYSYGVKETQFSNYVKEAVSVKGSNAAEKLYESLESRLDNVVYRLGIAHTRALARQMVSHGHFVVDGHKITVPSYKVKEGDIIKIREGSRGSVLFTDLATKLKDYNTPAWLKFDVDKFEAVVSGKPKNTETFLNFNTVLEFYSR